MKQLILINGTMGAGKSAVSNQLLRLLAPSVYLDGDWCWNMNPFVANGENKAMVLDNIAYLLRSFLSNSGYQYVIFCWVIHQEEIFEEIFSRLEGMEYQPVKITLDVSPAPCVSASWGMYGPGCGRRTSLSGASPACPSMRRWTPSTWSHQAHP